MVPIATAARSNKGPYRVGRASGTVPVENDLRIIAKIIRGAAEPRSRLRHAEPHLIAGAVVTDIYAGSAQSTEGHIFLDSLRSAQRPQKLRIKMRGE